MQYWGVEGGTYIKEWQKGQVSPYCKTAHTGELSRSTQFIFLLVIPDLTIAWLHGGSAKK